MSLEVGDDLFPPLYGDAITLPPVSPRSYLAVQPFQYAAQAARPLLARLGLERLTGQLPCVGVRAAWRSTGLHEQHFLSHPFGNGWLLDRERFGETLRGAAVAAGARDGPGP